MVHCSKDRQEGLNGLQFPKPETQSITSLFRIIIANCTATNSTIGVPRIVPDPGDKVCDYWIPGNVSCIIEQAHVLSRLRYPLLELHAC
jgi:hypothetical protein